MNEAISWPRDRSAALAILFPTATPLSYEDYETVVTSEDFAIQYREKLNLFVISKAPTTNNPSQGCISPSIGSCVPPITPHTLTKGDIIKFVNADVMAAHPITYLLQHPLRFGAGTSVGDESNFYIWRHVTTKHRA